MEANTFYPFVISNVACVLAFNTKAFLSTSQQGMLQLIILKHANTLGIMVELCIFFEFFIGKAKINGVKLYSYHTVTSNNIWLENKLLVYDIDYKCRGISLTFHNYF